MANEIDSEKYSHKHEGPADEPCKQCGLASDNPVHADDAPAPDPPPTGGDSGYPPN